MKSCFERFQRCLCFEHRVVRPDVGELMLNNSHGIAMKYEASSPASNWLQSRGQRAAGHSYARQDLLPHSGA